MVKDEKRIFQYIDLGIYLIFVPLLLVLVPTDRIIEHDPYFFVLMMCYTVVIHSINRKYNFVSLLFANHYRKAGLTILSIAVITYIASSIEVDDSGYLTSESVPSRLDSFRNRALYTLCFMDICFTVMLGLFTEIYRHKSELQEIEAEKDRAELAIYKSQINPHFMFNTLNTIYALNFTGSPNTSEVIMKFSNIVKYIYQNSDKQTIMIIEEVKYLNEFIDLHTLRLSEQTTVKFNYEIDDESQMVPSMVLITFVENVFKHGVSSSQDSTIEINLTLKDRVLRFSTSNKIFAQHSSSTKGIGIENCRKRLSLLYPSRHTLECGEHNGWYRMTLKIEL